MANHFTILASFVKDKVSICAGIYLWAFYFVPLIYISGALGRPSGMVWGGRREEGSGWGPHVYLWQIHFDIWQNQYNIVKLKKYI